MIAWIDNTTPKVFGIGLSRTGTTSLDKALNMLGYRSVHWRTPFENRVLRLEDAYFVDAITDINAAFQFETLFHVFPKAQFIYTERPLKDWIRSIQHHFDARTPADLAARLRKLPVTEHPATTKDEMHTPLVQAMLHGLFTSHASWEAAYAAHATRIEAFFDQRPSRLLHFDIFRKGHGWAELCNFLGKPVPKVSYPNASWSRPRKH